MSVDPERTRKDVFDGPSNFSGQDYDRRDEARQGAKMPSGTVGVTNSTETPVQELSEQDIPADAGHRARFDPVTGEVRGSGSGTGGGNPGENFDSDED